MDVTVNNLASVKGGRLLARGERIKTGKTICLSQAQITDEDGKILAHGSSKLLVTKGLQTIPQINGYSADIVPSKFLL
jgi:acyl-coenzyme A thioesterase PaaI-like protein